MMQVFASDADRDEVYGQLKLIEGYNCSPSGLTPPTKNIIKRKYIQTRMHKERPVTGGCVGDTACLQLTYL